VLRLLPDLGGAVGGWVRDGADVLHPVSDPNLIAQHERPVAAYALIPFSNRVGYGRFSFGGEDFQLAANFGGEPHTIHGNAWEREWQVAEAQASRAVLVLDHQGPAEQWPFHYLATMTYVLGDTSLEVTIRLENTDERAQPVGLGFHPFFPRTDDVELGFTASGVWQAGADSLPETRLPVEGNWRFDPIRPVAGAKLDNCYTGWTGEAVLHWPSRRLGLRIAASDLFGHLVVYTPPGRNYLAVEPASNMTDAVNRMDIADNGLRVLQSGEALEASVTLSLFGL
jgi:aldose 1-epimerase